jgi:hypothetical protein
MSTVFDAAQEHRVRRWFVGKCFRLAEQHSAVGDQDLIAQVKPQECRIGPTGGGCLDVGAHLIGPVGADPRQQRHAS